MTHCAGIRQIGRIPAIVTFAVLFASPGGGAQEAAISNWFRYDSGAATGWDASMDRSDPMRVVIHRTIAQGSTATRHVLVLYPRASSAYDIAITKILQVFEAKDLNVDFTVIDFDLDDDSAKQALDFAQHNDIDLIFAMGSESVAWLYNHYRGGAIPVVSVCSKDPVQLGQTPDYEKGSGSNFAFTSLNMPVEVQMAYIKELKPDLKNLAVLVDGKNVSAVQTQAAPIAAYAGRRGTHVIWGMVQDPNRARTELAQIVSGAVETMRKSDPDLVKSLFWVTGSTSVFGEIQTINKYADRVPVIGAVPEIVTAGTDTAVLAIGISFESNANLAAIYGAQILTGTARAGDLKVGIVTPPDIAISFLKAREIGMRVPLEFFESASVIYDYDGRPVRKIENKKSVE